MEKTIVAFVQLPESMLNRAGENNLLHELSRKQVLIKEMIFNGSLVNTQFKVELVKDSVPGKEFPLISYAHLQFSQAGQEEIKARFEKHKSKKRKNKTNMAGARHIPSKSFAR